MRGYISCNANSRMDYCRWTSRGYLNSKEEKAETRDIKRSLDENRKLRKLKSDVEVMCPRSRSKEAGDEMIKLVGLEDFAGLAASPLKEKWAIQGALMHFEAAPLPRAITTYTKQILRRPICPR